MVDNTIKLCRKFILVKLTKIWKENLGWNVFYIRGYDVTCIKFKTLQLHNFVKTDQNMTKFCTRFFFHKINKNMSQGWSSGLRFPLINRRKIKLTNWRTWIVLCHSILLNKYETSVARCQSSPNLNKVVPLIWDITYLSYKNETNPKWKSYLQLSTN